MSKLIIEDFFLDTINLKAFCDLKIEPTKPDVKFEKGKVVCDKIEFKITSQYSQSEYDRLFGQGDLRLSWRLKPLDEPDKMEIIAVKEQTTVEVSGSTLRFKAKNKDKKFILNLLEHSLYGEYKLGCVVEHSISYADGVERQLLDNNNMADVKSGIEFTIKGTEKKIGSKMQISCKLANESMKELFSKEYRLKVYLQEYVDEKEINHKDESDKIVVDISEKMSKEGKIDFDWYLGMDMDSSPFDVDTMVFSYPRIGKSSLFNYNCVLKLYKLQSEKSNVYVPYKTISSATGDLSSLKDIKKPVLKDFIVKKADEKKSYYDGLIISGKISGLANNISKLNLAFSFYAVDEIGRFYNIKRNETVTVKLKGDGGEFRCEVKSDEDDKKISTAPYSADYFRYFGAISIANSFISGEGGIRSFFNFSSYYRALTDFNIFLSDYKKIIKDSRVEAALFYGLKEHKTGLIKEIEDIMQNNKVWTPEYGKEQVPFIVLMLNAIYYTGNMYYYGKVSKYGSGGNYDYYKEKSVWDGRREYCYGNFLYNNNIGYLKTLVKSDEENAFKNGVTNYSKLPKLKVSAVGLLTLLKQVYLTTYSTGKKAELISFGITGDMVCSSNMRYNKLELLDIPEVENVLFYGFGDKDKETTKNYYKKLLSDVNEKGFSPEVDKFYLKSTVIMNGIYYLGLLYDWIKCDGKTYHKNKTTYINYYKSKTIYYNSYNISYAQFIYRHAKEEFSDFITAGKVPDYEKKMIVDNAASEIYTTANVERYKSGAIKTKKWIGLAGVPVKREGFQALVVKVFEKVTS